MTTTPVAPAEPAPTDATGSGEQPQGQPPAPVPAKRGRLYGFRAFRHPGFRIYFVGMLFRGLSMWMPLVAIPWLAVELEATPAQVGIITGFFFLPTLPPLPPLSSHSPIASSQRPSASGSSSNWHLLVRMSQ